ncbi:MAG: glycosyltransferase [Methanobacteriaceae archaeon]|nr:glycosyltransferase [Methanobacteriaceae archaeon]
MKISIVCVYNNKKILNEYLLNSLKKQDSSYEEILINNTKNKYTSASESLNNGGLKATSEYIIFLHQDIQFLTKTWLTDTIKIIDTLDNPGIIGVAGKGFKNNAVISNIKQGPDKKDVSPYKLEKPMKASTLDECILIIPKKVFNKLQFDEINCSDWHLYAIDYLLSIQKEGYEAYIIPSKVYHKSSGDSMSNSYYTTLKLLQKKHRTNLTINTCMGDWLTFLPINFQKKLFKKDVLVTTINKIKNKF